MCVNIANAQGAKRYINELLRSRGMEGYAAGTLKSAQQNYGWLLDHEIRDGKCQRIVITGDAGVAAVERAIDEVVKTAPKAKAKPKATAKLTV